MRVYVERDESGIAHRAADIVAEIVTAIPDAVLALPAGQTPLGMYRELVQRVQAGRLDFAGTRFFSLDEYAGVPPGDPRSFHHYLWKNLFSPIKARERHIHLLPATAGIRECDGYEAAIRDAGGVDLLIAGVGINGHIAFNEPGSDVASRTRLVELAPATLEKLHGLFSSGETPTHGVTMGIGTILEAKRILLLAAGPAKQAAIAALFDGKVIQEQPVTALLYHRDLTVIADPQAIG
jgi:glucosamine-6-phosphate deaminase